MTAETKMPLTGWGAYWRFSLVSSSLGVVHALICYMVWGPEFLSSGVYSSLAILYGLPLSIGLQHYVLKRDGHYLEDQLAHHFALYPVLITAGVFLVLGLMGGALVGAAYHRVIESEFVVVLCIALAGVLIGGFNYGMTRLGLYWGRCIHRRLFGGC